MKISPEHFECGGEVDCGACHRDEAKRFRVSIRKNFSQYEVYRHYHYPLSEEGCEEIEFAGTLKGCIEYVNQRYGYEDELEV